MYEACEVTMLRWSAERSKRGKSIRKRTVEADEEERGRGEKKEKGKKGFQSKGFLVDRLDSTVIRSVVQKEAATSGQLQ